MQYTSIPSVLNHILVTIEASFSMYLSYSVPYFGKDDDAVHREFDDMIADQKAYIKKLGELIIERSERPESGDFPIVFTDVHDLSAKYLLKELIRLHSRDVEVITQSVKYLRSDSEAHALGEEILGNARGHLETLKELASRPTILPLQGTGS